MPSGGREVLEFDGGVSAYEPTVRGGYWRVRWVESGRRRDTTARSRPEAISKANALVERLSVGLPTDAARAKGRSLVEIYLDPARRSSQGRPWSERHREEQEAYCRRFVLPAIADLPVSRLSRTEFQRILDQASTPAVAAHLRRCLSALVAVATDEGLLLARQDVLRGVRWHPPNGSGSHDEWDGDPFVDLAEIPSSDAVHRLARAAGELSEVWWRELEVLLVAYSGLRWGEHAALTADRVDVARRRIVVDRQVIETRSALKLAPPKSRRRRVTMYPAVTPAGIDLAELICRRHCEVGPEGLMFPAPRGGWARRSNYARSLFRPAATAAGWPRRDDGRWLWSFHSLRHVFATWALAQPGARIEDVSRLLGHSTVRTTQDHYIAPDTDLYDRFYRATSAPIADPGASR